MARILAFPMLDDAPDSPSAYHAPAPPTVPAFPATPPPMPGLLDKHEVLTLHFTHELLRIQRLGPMMTGTEVLALQGEWTLLARRLDAIEAAIKARTERHAKAVGLIA